MSTTTQSTITVDDGISVFYRASGPPTAPTVLLLHGFPSSSHMFRHLIPLLATRYRVIAPDLPGFGFTVIPASRSYSYTFASLAGTLSAFISALHLDAKPFAIYIFDYGAPVGLRYALSHPGAVSAIVSQNGNAYEEGLAPGFWGGLQKWWASGNKEDGDAVRFVLEMPLTKWQYENGAPDPSKIPPEAPALDQALMDREGNKEIQMALFYDYRTNVDIYDQFQAYLRDSGVPVLTAWGKGDECFIPPGAEAFKKDVKKLETKWLDAGHFALETNEAQMAEWMFEFFDKYEVFK